MTCVTRQLKWQLRPTSKRMKRSVNKLIRFWPAVKLDGVFSWRGQKWRSSDRRNQFARLSSGRFSSWLIALSVVSLRDVPLLFLYVLVRQLLSKNLYFYRSRLQFSLKQHTHTHALKSAKVCFICLRLWPPIIYR